MNTAKERVEQELKELDEKLDKLINFMDSNPKFNALSKDMQYYMCIQKHAMCIYQRALQKRLEVWDK